MKTIDKHSFQAFTLIEILVVVALIAILAAVTIVAINPTKNFADTRDATRTADVAAIIDAVTQFTYEQGRDISDIDPAISPCDNGVNRIGTCGDADCTDLNILVDEFIVAIPEDPDVGTVADTGYTMCLTPSSRVQIDAPNAENTTISVSR